MQTVLTVLLLAEREHDRVGNRECPDLRQQRAHSPRQQEQSENEQHVVHACRSRIPCCQAATGSWTRSRQCETQRTWFRSAGATVFPSANVSGVRPSKDAWQRAAL